MKKTATKEESRSKAARSKAADAGVSSETSLDHATPLITPEKPSDRASREEAAPSFAATAAPEQASSRDLEKSPDIAVPASDISSTPEPAAAPEPSPQDSQPSEKPEESPEPESEPPAPVQTESVARHPVSTVPPMFIVQITPELAPVAKVGGLADVVFGLSNELEIRGNHVEIILPKYDCLRYDHIWGLCETYKDLWVPWYGGAIHCTVYFGFVHGRKCFFIEPHSSDNFFNRGCIYGFNDDVLRFAFFTRAAMEFLWKSGKNPDVIHCHDWQTALAPVFLFEIYKFLGMTHPRVCFTIHNFKHQGVTGAQLLQATGLNRPEYYFHYDRLRDNFNPHALNLMKAGVVYSNFVTTVSPRHASEAKDQGQGFGLEPTLHIHHVKYGGVVNGIDYNVWNPEIDCHIPHRYGVDNIEEKYKNKKALRDRLMIADNEKPIVAFVGRLDPQKGLELIRHAIFYTLHRRGQFVLLGSSPDGQINSYFWSLKHQLNDNPDCHIEIGFNEELSHLIYAGADMILVPSQFEPCGLTQLIAMRYGTVPVVREVGGLADTVFDKDYSYKPLHERNGYVFKDYDYSGLESALGRALSCYYDYPEHFRELMKNAMRYDFSWKNPGQDYLNIYDYIREK
ncbi:glycogen synthase GlgA [Methylocaldum sp. MU1018]